MATLLETPTEPSLVDDITWAPSALAETMDEDPGDISLDLGSGYALTATWLIARLTAVVIIAVAMLYGLMALVTPALELGGLVTAAALSAMASLGYLVTGSVARR